MANFAVLGWYDAFDLAASLRTRMGLFRAGDSGSAMVLDIRLPAKGEDINAESIRWAWNVQTTRAKWPELHVLLNRMKRDAEARVGGEIEYGRIYLDLLRDASNAEVWTLEAATPYFSHYARCLLPVRASPGSLIVIGPESASPAPGWLTAINALAPRTAINSAQTPRIDLVIDSRRKVIPDA